MKNVGKAVVVAVLLGVIYLLFFGYNDCNIKDPNTIIGRDAVDVEVLEGKN